MQEINMIIDAISDLHGFYPKLEGGDMLIVAGDLTARHTKKELNDFLEWFEAQNYRKKIFTLGNHDVIDISGTKWSWCELLHDSGTEFEGYKIWGSPWSLWFDGINPRASAFTGSEFDLARVYKNIPKDIDILISHGPPHRILDMVDGVHTGSCSLYCMVAEINPKLLICGHIHEHGGKECNLYIEGSKKESIDCRNVSIVNEKYQHVNKPTRIVLP